MWRTESPACDGAGSGRDIGQAATAHLQHVSRNQQNCSRNFGSGFSATGTTTRLSTASRNQQNCSRNFAFRAEYRIFRNSICPRVRVRDYIFPPSPRWRLFPSSISRARRLLRAHPRARIPAPIPARPRPHPRARIPAHASPRPRTRIHARPHSGTRVHDLDL